MKISVVTISFNQAEFLQACIDSVAAQEGEFEHIIVDPGSTDGSRDIIEVNKKNFSHIILEKDEGPADGLNRGFSRATGNIYYYLNSDDVVFPDTFQQVQQFFKKNTAIDVVSGAGYVLDKDGVLKRKLWSDHVTRLGLAHGGSLLIQPSTFIKKSAFNLTNGFNKNNRSNWDGEIIVDIFEKGGTFKQINKFWSGYRVYAESITGSASLDKAIKSYSDSVYYRLTGKKMGLSGKIIRQLFRLKRIIKNPKILYQRLVYGRMYGAGK